MRKIITVLCLSLSAFPLTVRAITVEIPAGSMQSGGSVNSVVTQLVYGEADNFAVSGVQQIMAGGIARNSDIYPYGSQQIMAGGTAYNTHLWYSAVQTISGRAVGSVIDSRASATVRTGGVSENAVLNGGSLTVAAGGKSFAASLNGGYFYVSGNDYNAVINGGTQEIRAGGQAENAKITAGVQQVDEGGKALGTVVSGEESFLRVYGSVENAKAENDGSIIIAGGAEATGTLIDGGSMDVDKDAVAADSIVSAGSLHIYGNAEQSRVNGGRQTVHGEGRSIGSVISAGGTEQVNDGGQAEGSRLTNGGVQEVRAGGEVCDTIIDGAGSRQNLSGTAANTQILNNGRQIVEDGGKAFGSGMWNGGVQEIAAGGTAENAIVTYNGLQYIGTGGKALNTSILARGIQLAAAGGIAENTEISAYGLLAVENGGRALSPLVGSRGVLQIAAGGAAENAVVENGGAVNLDAGGSLSGTTQISGGSLYVAGSNDISALNLDGGTVRLSRKAGFSTLHFGRLEGSGNFYVSSNLSAGLSDRIVIDDGSGSFGLAIHDYSADGNLPEKFTIIDESAAAGDSFHLIGGAADAGALLYNLERQEDGSWMLVKTKQANDMTIVAKNTYAALASLFYTHLSPVYGHLRTTRKNPENSRGLWIKGLGKKIKFRFKDDSKSRLETYGTEIGYGQTLWQNGEKIFHIGIFGGYTHARQKYDRAGSGIGKTGSLGLYAAYNAGGGWFADFVGSWFWHRQKISAHKPDSTAVLGKYDTNGRQAAAEAGRRFELAGGWYAETSLLLDYMAVDGIRYRTNFNTEVKTSTSDYLSAGAGLAVGRIFTSDNGGQIEPYARFRLLYDWDGKTTVKVADYAFNEKISSLHYEFGLGINAAFKEDWSLYAEAATRLGSKENIPWEFGCGLRFAF